MILGERIECAEIGFAVNCGSAAYDQKILCRRIFPNMPAGKHHLPQAHITAPQGTKKGARSDAPAIQFCPASAMFSAWSEIRSRSVSAST